MRWLKIMDSIVLNSTSDTPKIVCTDDGTITIIGRSLTEDPLTFYKPILDWVQQLNVENIEINVRLEYLNTSSSLQIYNLLELAKKNPRKNSIIVRWYYDMLDEDGRSLGEEFEAMLEVPFEFFNFLDT
jgi:hypothetical protein